MRRAAHMMLSYPGPKQKPSVQHTKDRSNHFLLGRGKCPREEHIYLPKSNQLHLSGIFCVLITFKVIDIYLIKISEFSGHSWRPLRS